MHHFLNFIPRLIGKAGRIGQWVGMKIVEAYMNFHPDLTLTDLIKETDAQRYYVNLDIN